MKRQKSMEYREFSDKWLADLYLKHGSVEEVIASFDGHFPVSVADFHRKIKNFGIVKGSGRSKVSLAQTLYFFAQKAMDPRVPLEKLYKSMPPSFKESTSMATLHRIYGSAMRRATRLQATGLIITNTGDLNNVLVADEIKSNKSVGKISGITTIPLAFANKNEDCSESILRVLQQEVSTSLTVNKSLVLGSHLAKSLVPENISPIMQFHILDIKLDVFHIKLPEDFKLQNSLSSYKVNNHRFLSTDEIINHSLETKFRIGIPEIISEYRDNLYKPSEALSPSTITSALNTSLLATESSGQ